MLRLHEASAVLTSGVTSFPHKGYCTHRLAEFSSAAIAERRSDRAAPASEVPPWKLSPCESVELPSTPERHAGMVNTLPILVLGVYGAGQALADLLVALFFQ